MLGQPENDGQFVITPGSGDRMHGSGHTLVPVVGFPRSRGEGPILKEERLVSGKSVLEEVCFPSFILSPQTILVKDRVELLLCLGGDVVV